MPITPAFLFDLESNMRVIATREYERLNANIWWRSVMKLAPRSSSKKERLIWLLDTARIQKNGKGGNIEFDDIVSQTTEFEFENAAAGLKIKKEELDDIDGNGVDYATHWSRQMGAYSAYWPQKMLAQAMLANGTTYDTKAFFATDHPVNPYDSSAGTYANLFTGAASGSYPGALPIDDSVTMDVAIQNLAKAYAYVASIPMPNGEDPRNLRIAGLVVPPMLMPRAVQLTSAKFIAQVAGSYAASADVEALIRKFGLGEPIVAPELGAAFGGSDTDYYLLMEEVTTSELGAFVYVPREEFSILFYGPQTDAQLGRIREYQWLTEGRNNVLNGHPYLLVKGRKT